MVARVAVIGLDATEPTVFAAMLETALGASAKRTASAGLVGLHDLLPDTVWPEIRTGMSAAHTGIYYQINQFRSGETISRPRRRDELGIERFYWNVAAQHGARVATLDQPLSAPASLAALDITEWGAHDRLGYRAPARSAGVDAGPYPVVSCDRANHSTTSSKEELCRLLIEGVGKKTRLLSTVIEQDDWDLLTAVYSEGHCAGHQFWPPDGRGDGALRNAVYEALAESVASLLAELAGSATVIVYSSHGMAPADHGARFVAPLLTRMGLCRPVNRTRRRVAGLVPALLRARLGRALGVSRIRAMGLASRWSFEDPAVTAIPLPSSRVGAVRLSMAGRDPGGKLVRGSHDHDRRVDDLLAEFSSLSATGDGGPVVRDVVVTDDVMGDDRHPDLPDLIVRFRTDIGPIGDVTSRRLGSFTVPITSPRTGEHGTPGALWVWEPRLGPGTRLEDVRTIDLAPTILARLGITVPDWMDGSPIPDITG